MTAAEAVGAEEGWGTGRGAGSGAGGFPPPMGRGFGHAGGGCGVTVGPAAPTGAGTAGGWRTGLLPGSGPLTFGGTGFGSPAPKTSPVRLLSARGSEGMETPQRLRARLPPGWGMSCGAGSSSCPVQPGGDPRKPRVTLLGGCKGRGWDGAVAVVLTRRKSPWPWEILSMKERRFLTQRLSHRAGGTWGCQPRPLPRTQHQRQGQGGECSC